jgi:hypothetical protein
MNKYDIERMKRITDNEALVADLMRYSPYGGLCQAFIMEAIQEYSARVIATPVEKLGNGLVSGEAWQGIAMDVKSRCDAFYGRHQMGHVDDDDDEDEREWFHPND